MAPIRRAAMAVVMSGLLMLAFAGSAFANNHTQRQVGGAAGLVAAVVQVQTGDIDVDVLNRSLNNLLRNADIDVLNNVLNNTLRDSTITLTDTVDVNGNVIAINVLSGGVTTGILDLS